MDLGLGSNGQCLGTPLKCLFISFMILVIIGIAVFLPVIGIPIDVVLLIITAFVGRDMFGLSGLFKGLGGIFK